MENSVVGICLRILVCGDRNWTAWKPIEDFIKTLPKDTVIIHGDCRGADKMAGYMDGATGKEAWDKSKVYIEP